MILVFLRKSGLVVFGLLLGLLSLEMGLRIRLWARPFEPTPNLSTRKHDILGWAPKPSYSGVYSDGYFLGEHNFSELGIRWNGVTDTREPHFEDILVLGDSNTLSLEVNDDKTIPALLEREYRDKAVGLNFINLGVRGYGTDQSVERAIEIASHFKPGPCLYIYSGNDVFDNNVLKTPLSAGKGVFLEVGGRFEERDSPVAGGGEQHWEMVLMNDSGLPQVYSGSEALPAYHSPSWFTLGRAVEGDPILRAWNKFEDRELEPNLLVRPVEKISALSWALADGGRYRLRYPDYYRNQMAHILQRLRSKTQITKIYVVMFPSPKTLELLSRGEPSQDIVMFESLSESDVIDGFLDLNSLLLNSGRELEEFECGHGEAHFSHYGNSWVCGQIVKAFNFHE